MKNVTHDNYMDGFLTEPQARARVHVSRRTFDRWRAEGRIPTVKAGKRRVLFHWPSVEAALLKLQTQGTPTHN